MMSRPQVTIRIYEAVAYVAVLLALAASATRASAQLPDPNQGPGGPILVITSTSTYSKFYAEILRTEGLNEFAVMDIGAVTPAILSAYDVAILAPTALTTTQVSTFSNWVNLGGNLIAMRPDPQLGTLLGIAATGSTLSNAYLLVDTSTAVGNGIVSQPMQFHDSAGIYTLSGASKIATLYSNPSTATPNPAVTLHSVGTNGGQAAAFAYDLATSIVYTRQGNPAWATQERDGFSPIRSNDKFYGAAATDPQPDWVDLDNLVSIPQADEQQRLLANLIVRMNLAKKPLPRFWYFPRGKRAVVVMTGDDHGNGGTAGRFDQQIAASPAGCIVDNWECVRSTSYMFVQPQNISDAQAASYTAQGFEVGLHINTNCGDFTPASLDTIYSEQIAQFQSSYPSIPAAITQRHHCIAWSDWVTGAKTQLKYGMRLDTSFYFWPPGWAQNRPGHFTGSAMPMRFADLDGTIVNVYNAPTQMTDESGQTYPFTSDALLSAAVGPQGYYGVYTVNSHTDTPTNPVSDAVIPSALSRGVPVVSSVQMLRWLDARNSSSFGGLAWSGNTLSFAITPGSGANGLQAMVPMNSTAGVLASISGPSGPVQFTADTIKGTNYAFFSAAAGTYTATYAADTTPPTVTSTSPAAGATGISQSATVSATFSEAMDASTINVNTFVLRDAANAVVPASFAYSASTRIATLTPSASLAASATYTATVTTGVRDLSGNALAANQTWSFTTAAGPSCPCTIWDSSTVPANPAVNDPNAVELGVKFRVDLNGFISGVRFYKGTTNTGIHVGNLWTTGGQLLATATFNNETASGWQQVNFSTPVAVTANTVYIASYHTTSGNYAANTGQFSSAGVDNAPVHLLRDGVSGGNGVYAYGASSSFPADTFQSSNYWVDIVFTTSGSSTPVPLAVSSTNPANNATGISPTTSVSITSNNALNASTVTTSSFTLRNSSTSAVVTTSAPVVSGNTATITPTSALAASTSYTATITTAVRDTNGSSLSSAYSWSFTTSTGTTSTVPEPAGWFSGDMHVHRSCGGSPEGLSSILTKMTPQNLAVISLLADSGNAEVQNATTDLPLVNGQDASISTPGRIVHWDTEWHWDAIYTQYDHQALGGHIVNLGLNRAEQLWFEYTFPVIDWAHQNGGIAGFAHMQYLDNNIPQSLTCCTPIEYPVEVALGAADFISEDVADAGNIPSNMNPTAFVQAYYRLLNTGFRPGFAAGTDYPCNSGRDLGALLTYVQIPSGQMTYRNWIDGIKTGRTVVSRNGHREFLNLKVNGVAGPGDQINLAAAGSVSVSVQWTAMQSFTGTVELVSNGVVVASQQATVGSGSPFTLNATVNFPKSGWIAARRMGADGHQVHTAAVFVIVNNAPIRVSAADAQFYVEWMDNLLTKTSPGGVWNSFFPTSLTQAQARYSAAKAIFQQIAAEAAGATPLGVTSTIPAGAATGVSTTTAISATFSNSLDSTTVNGTSFTVRDAASNLVSGTYSVTGSTATLTPTTALAASTLYTVTLTTAIKDVAGNTLAANYTWTFTTAAAGGTVCTTNCTIWPSSAVPATIDQGADNPVQLGVKFRSDVAGSITGIRFYKATANTGTHVGSLWSSTGQLLASAPFTAETPSGWQQVNFATPVAITANTVYIASYHTTVGHYSGNVNYFATTGVSSPPLYALRNGESGANSVYAYGAATAFPNQTYNATNYWVDVVFSSAPAATLTSIAVTPTNPSIAAGSSQQFTATGTYSDNTTKDITSEVTWASSATAVATINATGLATSLSSGSSTISATLSSVAGSTALTVQPAPVSITTTSLPDGTVGVAYTAALTASSGTSPYIWSIASGTLPSGLTLNASNGSITGTPTTAGTSTLSIQVLDSASPASTATKSLTLTVQPTSVSITTASLPGGTVGVAYSATLGASGGITPYTWSISTGTLPGGLTLNASNGSITGTPTTAGTSALTIQVSDSASPASTATKSLTLTVQPPPVSITTASLPGGTVGVAYSATLAASGGATPYTWSITTGTLPGGLTLNASNGSITGTPTTAGTSNFTVQVSDSASPASTATKSLTLTVQPPVSITTASLPGGTVGVAYSATLAASGGTTPYIWSISTGTLPAGLALNASNGGITGTPTTAGTSNFTVQVSDSASPASTATKSLTLTVQPPPVSITTASLPGGTVGVAYSATLVASGGTTPYTWSISTGTLPGGLTLNASNGSITGTPTTAGTSNFTVRVTDSASTPTTATRNLSVAIAGPVVNTGFLAPTAHAPVTTNAGDNDGFQTTPANAFVPDGLFAVDPNSGTNTNPNCGNAGKDKHVYFNYSFNLPAGVAIRGIEVRLDANVSSTANAPKMCVQLSWNGGSSWTAAQSTATLTTTPATYTLGGAANTWGRTWTLTNLSNTNFRVRIINVAQSTARTFSLDGVGVRVNYQ